MTHRRRAIQRKRFARLLIAAVLLIGLIALDRSGWLLVPNHDDVRAYEGRTARVVRVIDGDTLEIDLPDALKDTPTTRVRLWGVDAPERATVDLPAEPGAEEATRFLREWIEGGEIRLRLEPDTRDRYQRLLAHVETIEGENINARLLSEGLALAEDRWPHTMLREYERLERIARLQQRGLWAEEE